MSLVLQITTGSRTGDRAEFTTDIVLAGRHPQSDLLFDAQKDLDVSTRHARFRGTGDGWSVSDLGSTNGTWVNGAKISAPTTLRAGDVVRLGADGPRLEVVSTGSVAGAAVPRTELRRSSNEVRPSHTEERVAAAVAKQTGAMRKVVFAMAAVVVVGVGALVYINQKQTGTQQKLIDALLRKNDSLATATSGREAGLDSVARELRKKSDALAKRMLSGENVDAELSALSQQQKNVMASVAIDWRNISKRNNAAVVFVYAMLSDGTKEGGTGFCITEKGIIVTNKHVIAPEGKELQEVAVVFSDRQYAVHAKVMKISDDADLAFLQIADEKTYPTVLGVARSDTVTAGTPIAIIGFPLGESTLMGGDNAQIKKTSLMAGTLSKVVPDQLQLDAYAAPGSSGSPVFDARGYVIGVISSGNSESGGRIVYAVSGSELVKNIPADARGIIK